MNSNNICLSNLDRQIGRRASEWFNSYVMNTIVHFRILGDWYAVRLRVQRSDPHRDQGAETGMGFRSHPRLRHSAVSRCQQPSDHSIIFFKTTWNLIYTSSLVLYINSLPTGVFDVVRTRLPILLTPRIHSGVHSTGNRWRARSFWKAFLSSSTSTARYNIRLHIKKVLANVHLEYGTRK